jgi:hypothetical protein
VRRWWVEANGDDVELELLPWEFSVTAICLRDRYGVGRYERTEEVRVSWDPVHFGGVRPWFHCPRCERRSSRLFLDDLSLVCRKCAGVLYASQLKRVSPEEKLRARARQIRVELGGMPSADAPFPTRPKGMHRRTYERLQEEAFRLEAAAERAAAVAFAASLKRYASELEKLEMRAARVERAASRAQRARGDGKGERRNTPGSGGEVEPGWRPRPHPRTKEDFEARAFEVRAEQEREWRPKPHPPRSDES